MDNSLNFFWAAVWAVVLILAVIGLFWTPAIWFVIAIATGLFGMFVYDYIRVKWMK